MKFLVKEFSIKKGENVNDRYLKSIKDELLVFVNEIKLNISQRQSNFAIWESTDFSITDFTLGNNPEKLQKYLTNTLNFRYENFEVKLIA